MDLDAIYGVPVAVLPEPLQSAVRERVAQLPTLAAAAQDGLLLAYVDTVCRWRQAYWAAHGRYPEGDG